MNLKILDVSNNRISKVEGLETLTQVRGGWLWLSPWPASGVPAPPALWRCSPYVPTCCRGAGNPPTHPTLPLSAQLTDLWLNDNAIESLDEVEAALASQRATLSCVYLKGNPCAGAPSYALRMRHLLPKLTQLDDNPVGPA